MSPVTIPREPRQGLDDRETHASSRLVSVREGAWRAAPAPEPYTAADASPAPGTVTRRTKVLLMLPSMHGGGAQRMALHLFKHLDRSRFDVRIGLLEASGPYLSSLEESEYVSAPSWVGRLLDPHWGHSRSYTPVRFMLRVLLGPASVLYTLIKTKPDVILTFLQGTSFATVPAVAMYGRRRIRWIAREGNNAMAVLDNEIPRITLRRFIGAIVRHCYKRADCVLTISKDLGVGLARRFAVPPASIATIYNAVDLATIRQRATMPLPAGRAIGEPYIVSIGRLEYQKGHDVLLDAYARSQARHALKLVILGEGGELTALRQQAEALGIADRVHFLGFEDNPWSYAAAADMFVLASRWEGFGNVVIEAMACRLPVIVTDCDFGPREIVTDGENGLVVGAGDPEALARAMDLCHSDAPLRKKLVAGGLVRACDFDVATITGQYADLFLAQVSKLRNGSRPAHD